MSFLDEIRKSITDMSKASDSFVKRSGDVIEAQKIRLQKATLESDLKTLYEEAGKLYFEKIAEEDLSEEMNTIAERIAECQKAIAEADARVASLRGVLVCQECQSEVDKDAQFCPKCGAKIDHPEPVVEEELDVEEEPAAEEKLSEEDRQRKIDEAVEKAKEAYDQAVEMEEQTESEL